MKALKLATVCRASQRCCATARGLTQPACRCQALSRHRTSAEAGCRVQVISALLCNCLGLDHSRLSQFRFSAGSITVVEWPSADDLSRVNVRALAECLNGCLHPEQPAMTALV